MRRVAALPRRCRAAHGGVTIVEFALVVPLFLLLILGLTDLGYRQYLRAMLNGALVEAARQVTVGSVAASTVSTFVNSRMQVVYPGSSVTVTPNSYYNYTGIGTKEPITTDVNGDGIVESGDCYTDYNGDGSWDTDNGISGVGGSEDIVYYTATMTYPSFVPAPSLLGFGSTETVTTTTMMRNQPYGAQVNPQTVCMP